ncbi:MAG: histidine kinase, partial [Antricoccus sp.]
MTEHGEIGVVAPTSPIKLRQGRPGSLRLALIVIAISAALLGGLQLAVGAAAPDNPMWAIAMLTGAFWIWVAAGVVAWWRRPTNATGALIVFGGLSVFVGGLANLNIEILAVIGAVFATTVLGITVHLLHAFPSGRLRGRLSSLTVIGGYIVAVGLQALGVLVRNSPAVFTALRSVQGILGLLVMIVTVIVLVARLRAADRDYRKVLLPLFLYGSLAVVLIPLAVQVLRPIGASVEVIFVIQLGLIAGLPVAFLVGVLVGGYSRTGELEALSAWLGLSGPTKSAVANALASTLGDDSLRVVYWSAARSMYVDEFGATVDATGIDHNHSMLDVWVDSRLVGAIIYNNQMIGDEREVRRAGDVLAIAVDRERLTAELRASNDELLQSRLRLVETADRERTRIAQDLHDGLQMQLVLVAIEAQQIGTAPGASESTLAASTQLRHRIDEAAAD